MPKGQIPKSGYRPRAAALLVGAACLALAATQPMARQDASMDAAGVRFLGAEVMHESPRGLASAAMRFVRAMAEGDAEEVWMFASEEEHDAFQTEQAAFRAYALDFPVLTRAKEVMFLRAWQEEETPFVEMILRDASDRSYRAELGLWLSDAGDWRIVSLGIEPTSELTAGL